MTPILIIALAWGGALLMTLATMVLIRGKHEAPPKVTAPAKPAMPQLAPEDIDRLKVAAEAAFTKSVQEAAASFNNDLQASSQQLNKLIIRLTTEVVERELQDYRTSLAKSREEALLSLKNMQGAVESKQQELESDMDAELAKRREYLIERLDNRLGEAVAAYIVESLGQGADLGAQRAFLLSSLERHKDDLKREVNGE